MNARSEGIDGSTHYLGCYEGGFFRCTDQSLNPLLKIISLQRYGIPIITAVD